MIRNKETQGMWLYRWLAKKLGKGFAWLIIVLVILGVLFGIYKSVENYFTAGLETQIKLGKGQTGAAIESGHQAVNDVANRQDAEANGVATVQGVQHEINNATDPGAVTAAGLDGLHRVRRQESDRRRR
jgi:predicted PurR-regulated permease PerM